MSALAGANSPTRSDLVVVDTLVVKNETRVEVTVVIEINPS